MAVVLDCAGKDAKVLQSHSAGFPAVQPGVNKSFTVAQSHGGGFYEYAVLPEDWFGADL